MRSQVAPLKLASMDWLFQWQYQSSDEDDVEAVTGTYVQDLAEGTKSDVQTRKVFCSRAPAWRTEEVRVHGLDLELWLIILQTNHLLDRLDVFVLRERMKKTGRGSQYRPRIRGPSREADKSRLPFPPKRSIRIPWNMVDPDWLKTTSGATYDSRVYIADVSEEADGEANGEEASGDGGGEEGEGQHEDEAGGTQEQPFRSTDEDEDEDDNIDPVLMGVGAGMDMDGDGGKDGSYSSSELEYEG